jgi:excisionase family DNA binding protein
VDERYLTMTEACEYANVERRTIYHAVKHGKLQAGRLPGGRTAKYRFKRQWIDHWLTN